MARDTLNQDWRLPGSVTIPLSGQVLVTATAVESGALQALPGTITTMQTVVRGWQSVTNPSAAIPGAPSESDATLRRRQASSTALPSRTILEGLQGAVQALPSVERLRLYENNTSAPDANGLPAHSIAVVAEGGDASAIAGEVLRRKTIGVGTFGSLVVPVQDANGITQVVRISRPTAVPVAVTVVVRPKVGYTTPVLASIQARLQEYLTGLPIGEDVSWSSLFGPAATPAQGVGTFDILSLVAGRTTPLGTTPITMAWNEVPSAGTVTVTAEA